jgi:hypothetical protein
MMSFTKWILAPILAVGTMGGLDSNQANADIGIYSGRGVSIRVGGGYPGYRSLYGPSYRSIYGHGFTTPYRSFYSRGHYRYHPREIIRHRSHYHLVPGHFDYYPGRLHGHHRRRGGHCHY